MHPWTQVSFKISWKSKYAIHWCHTTSVPILNIDVEIMYSIKHITHVIDFRSMPIIHVLVKRIFYMKHPFHISFMFCILYAQIFGLKDAAHRIVHGMPVALDVPQCSNFSLKCSCPSWLSTLLMFVTFSALQHSIFLQAASALLLSSNHDAAVWVLKSSNVLCVLVVPQSQFFVLFIVRALFLCSQEKA